LLTNHIRLGSGTTFSLPLKDDFIMKKVLVAGATGFSLLSFLTATMQMDLK